MTLTLLQEFKLYIFIACIKNELNKVSFITFIYIFISSLRIRIIMFLNCSNVVKLHRYFFKYTATALFISS